MNNLRYTKLVGFLLLAGILSFSGLQAQERSRPETDTLCAQLERAKEVGMKKYRLDLSQARAGEEGGDLRTRSLTLYYMQTAPKDGKGFQYQLFLAETQERNGRTREFSKRSYYFHPEGDLLKVVHRTQDERCTQSNWYFQRGDLLAHVRQTAASCEAASWKRAFEREEDFEQEEILQSLAYLEQSKYIQDLFLGLASLQF